MALFPRKNKELSAVSEVPVLETDPGTGLSAAEVELRSANGLANKSVEPPTRTVGQILRANLLTYFNAVFVLLAAALIAVRASVFNLTFLGVVIVNAVIGIVQELKSKKALDELSILQAPRAVAVRDGQEDTIPTDQLVRDDIVHFSAGEQMYDFIYITDAAKTFAAIGEKGIRNRTYYIGSPEPKPLKEFLLAMRDCVDPGMEIGLGELPFSGVSLTYREFDIHAVEKDTGFVPEVSFEEGIRKTAAWIREEG